MNSENLEFLNKEEFQAFLKTRMQTFWTSGVRLEALLILHKNIWAGKNGVGIDIDANKVKKAQESGLDAALYDINNIPDEKLVRFVIMSHFLEHVPNMFDVKDFIRKACTISKDFVYIQQPFFDADPYLFAKGLKSYSSDWRGHPNRMTSLEFWILLRDLKEAGLPITFSLHARKQIFNSKDPYVHPLTSPIDQHDYDAKLHPPKTVPSNLITMFSGN